MSQIATTIEQSKKLIELGLSPKTADMYYDVIDDSFKLYDDNAKLYVYDGLNPDVDWISYDKILPAWSLSALINLLPSKLTEKNKYSETTYKIDIRKYALTEDIDVYQIAYGYWKIYEGGDSSWRDRVNTGQKENLIDAVFEMVYYLLENKLI